MKKIDLENLSTKEVNDLIRYEKYPLDPLQYQEVYNQIISNMIFEAHNYSCEIKDKSRNIIYDFTVHTTPIESRFSIGLRFTSVCKFLIRFDFGDTLKHKNNFGLSNETVITGSHVHINSATNKYKNKNVIPISSFEDFKNLKLIKDVFLEVINYTNIRN